MQCMCKKIFIYFFFCCYISLIPLQSIDINLNANLQVNLWFIPWAARACTRIPWGFCTLYINPPSISFPPTTSLFRSSPSLYLLSTPQHDAAPEIELHPLQFCCCFFTLNHSPSSHKGRCSHMGPDHVLRNLCLTRFQKTIIFAGSLIKWSADEQVHLVWFQIARQHAHWISELAKVRSS